MADVTRLDNLYMGGAVTPLATAKPVGTLVEVGTVVYMSVDAATPTYVPVIDGTIASADDEVLATVTATGGVGGSATGTLAIQLNRKAAPATPIATAKRLLIQVKTVAAGSDPVAGLQGTVTFGNATVGSIVESGAGWALILTSATGAFLCDMTDASDETVNVWAGSPNNVTAALTTDCDCSPVFDAATWAP